jgi:hypothetical protein
MFDCFAFIGVLAAIADGGFLECLSSEFHRRKNSFILETKIIGTASFLSKAYRENNTCFT